MMYVEDMGVKKFLLCLSLTLLQRDMMAYHGVDGDIKN